MKTFGMAFVAAFMCMNFVACNSDDEPKFNDDGIVTNEKKLVEMIMDKDKFDDDTLTFSYDNEGRLNFMTKRDGEHYYTYSFIWEENSVIEEVEKHHKYLDHNDYNCTYTNVLADQRIIESDDYTLTYDSSKRLSTLTWNSRDTRAFYWENDNISKVACSYSGEKKITYYTNTCKGYFPLSFYFLNRIDGPINLLFVHPELGGVKRNSLFEKIEFGHYLYTGEFSYTFDDDGYVETCTVQRKRGDSPRDWETSVYTFKWE